jgi:hypothetical protein
MADFWRDSGYHLLQRDASGHLGVTDDFLRAYIARPELAPIAESCAAERALHAALLANPRAAVAEARLATSGLAPTPGMSETMSDFAANTTAKCPAPNVPRGSAPRQGMIRTGLMLALEARRASDQLLPITS